MITNFIPSEGDLYLVPDAEPIKGQPSVEPLMWGGDEADISIFRHIGAYADSHEGWELAAFHLEVITRLLPNAPVTKTWIRPSPNENTLMFRKWVDDYVL